jgi:hypothetical protein
LASYCMCPLRDVAIVADLAGPGFPRTSTFCSPTRVISRRFACPAEHQAVERYAPRNPLLSFGLTIDSFTSSP